MKVLSEADGLTLANLCIAVSVLDKAQAHINKSGILYKAPSGYVMQSPLLPDPCRPSPAVHGSRSECRHGPCRSQFIRGRQADALPEG
jgi:hypothetical protein